MVNGHYVRMPKRILCAILSVQLILSGAQVFATKKISANTQPAAYSTVGLSAEELKKCELFGVNKKDWAQRLQWFESKIINHYKSLNKQNILVVGSQKFLDAFKQATEKHNWQANFTYATSANSPEINGGGIV